MSTKLADEYIGSEYIICGYNRMIKILLPSDIEYLIILYYGINLAAQIHRYYVILQQKEINQQAVEMIVTHIRNFVLLHGCPDDDIVSELTLTASGNNTTMDTILTTKIRNVDDTLRGQLWRLVLGVTNLDAEDYKNQIKKGAATNYYTKIRGDTKRTFLTSAKFNSRVSEESLIRVLNAFVHRHNVPYAQGMDAIAAGLLYTMPELNAFTTFCLLINKHFPTYFYSDITHRKDLIGAYAGSYLAWDILKICDNELFIHLQILPPHAIVFPLVASFQSISQPFTELIKLWDFLFCFGVHLNPIIAAAQIISNKKLIISQTVPQLVQGFFSGRKWMNANLDSKCVIECCMLLIILLKRPTHRKLWKQISKHSSNFDVAVAIKTEHEYNYNVT